MKKSLLAIALAVASMPMVFAQAAPQNPPASGTTANSPATTKTPKAKHHKAKTTKKTKKNATGNSLVKSAK